MYKFYVHNYVHLALLRKILGTILPWSAQLVYRVVMVSQYVILKIVLNKILVYNYLLKYQNFKNNV